MQRPVNECVDGRTFAGDLGHGNVERGIFARPHQARHRPAIEEPLQLRDEVWPHLANKDCVARHLEIGAQAFEPLASVIRDKIMAVREVPVWTYGG